MMKNEFITILKNISSNTDIRDEDYCSCEHVYSYHPAIKSKEHIVQLYVDFGMTAVNDMLPRADKIAQAEDKVRVAEMDLEILRNELLALKEA